MPKVVPVILAGGSGTRLWPESRTRMPKHLAPILGERSLLQIAAERVMAFAHSQAIFCVGAVDQSLLIGQQLRTINADWAENLLFEPSRQNTAAAIHLAALAIRDREGSDAVMWVCPADHIMLDADALYQAVEDGLAAADGGMIVTFGIEPSRPETGYGYIEVDQQAPSNTPRGDKILAVRRFVEKPALERARAMLDAGGFYWNSGMFLMRAGTLLRAMEEFEPAIAATVLKAYQAYKASGIIDPALYKAVKSMPVDKAVMERSPDMMVVPCDPKWSDVGGWQAIWEISQKDNDDNAVKGDVLLAGCSGNLVRAGSRLVALAGVDNLAVIELNDAVLVADRTAGDEIRAIVEQLNESDRLETGEHTSTQHGWGTVCRLAATEGAEIRELTITGDYTLGDDGHARHISVLSGQHAGEQITLKAGERRSFAARGDRPVRLIETRLTGMARRDH